MAIPTSRTTSPASAQLPASTYGPGRLFINSQFYANPKLPGPETDLSDQTAIITGSSRGLGLAACDMMLSLKLSRLVMAVRSMDDGEAAAEELRAKYPAAKVDVWRLEMLSYQSIQEFAARCQNELPRLDIAILNAGLTRESFRINPSTGHEEVFQVNYLSTVLLSILLLPILRSRSPPDTPGRLTIVSSGMAMHGKFPEHVSRPMLPAFSSKAAFDPIDRYSTTKFLLQMLAAKLTEYVPADQVIVNTVDPGFCKGTGLHRHLNPVLRVLFTVFKWLSARPVEHGASTFVDAAVVKGAETHGSYLMDWEIRPMGAFYYKPECDAGFNRLWEETMKELEFANAQGNISSFQDRK